MDKTNFYYYDLPFWQDLTRLGEAMQYAFNREPKSDYDKKNKQYWIGEVTSITRASVCAKIKEFKTENAEFLAESPILAALLDSYIAVSETDDPSKLKAIYTAFQNIQKDLPFAENKAAYVDAGCSFSSGSGESAGVTVLFPITLYSGYDPQGQRDDDHRGGYLYPVHSIEGEEIKQLHESRPILVEKLKGFKAAYERATSAPGGPANN